MAAGSGAVAGVAAGAGRLEEKIRQARRLAPKHFAAYCWLHHRDDRDRRIALPPHMQVIAAHLQNPTRYPYVVFVVPPGYGKSSLASIMWPAWRQGNTGGTARIGLVSNTATQARGFAKAFQQAVESDEYQRTFPNVRPDLRRGWGSQEMYFTNTPQGSNPGLIAMGIDGPILGKRFDSILFDDPSTWADVRSETVMEGQRNKLLNTLVQRFPAGSRPPQGDRRTQMYVLMTRYGERDLCPTFVDDLDFHLVHMPARGYWDRIVKCGKCGQSAQGKVPCEHDPRHHEVEFGEQALWPQKEPVEMLNAMEEADQITFRLVYMGDTSVLSGNVFSDAWFQRGPLPGWFDHVVQAVDTAGGKDQKHGDYFAITTVGLRDGQVWIIEAYRDRLASPEQERKIVEKYEQWSDAGMRPELIAIESVNEGKAVYDHLCVSHRLPLKPVDPEGKDKTFRAVPLSNAYRARRVWHPEGERWVRAFEAELLAFPEGAHDDMVDSAAYAYNESGGAGVGVRLRVL